MYVLAIKKLIKEKKVGLRERKRYNYDEKEKKLKEVDLRFLKMFEE